MLRPYEFIFLALDGEMETVHTEAIGLWNRLC